MEMKQIKVNELFNKEQLKEITTLIKKNDLKGLKAFLDKKGIKEMLLEKEILSDYLYYYLQYLFGLGVEK